MLEKQFFVCTILIIYLNCLSAIFWNEASGEGWSGDKWWWRVVSSLTLQFIGRLTFVHNKWQIVLANATATLYRVIESVQISSVTSNMEKKENSTLYTIPGWSERLSSSLYEGTLTFRESDAEWGFFGDRLTLVSGIDQQRLVSNLKNLTTFPLYPRMLMCWIIFLYVH